jgi:hypothetical protein
VKTELTGSVEECTVGVPGAFLARSVLNNELREVTINFASA